MPKRALFVLTYFVFHHQPPGICIFTKTHLFYRFKKNVDISEIISLLYIFMEEFTWILFSIERWQSSNAVVTIVLELSDITGMRLNSSPWCLLLNDNRFWCFQFSSLSDPELVGFLFVQYSVPIQCWPTIFTTIYNFGSTEKQYEIR